MSAACTRAASTATSGWRCGPWTRFRPARTEPVRRLLPITSPALECFHMFQYPHTIENGLGESLTFLRRVSTPQGETLEVENCVQPGGGPPMHVHYLQEESITVVEGRLAYQRPGEDPH